MSALESLALGPELLRPLKRSEYDRMVELGLFADERVELIRGMLVKMSPQDAPHASTVQKLNHRLMALLGSRFVLRVQSPLALSADSEPEPDVAVVPLGEYDTEHPSSALLVIEVADSTLRKDRLKAAIYASAQIGEYWIVNLAARTVEVHTAPDGERYGESRTLRAGELLRPTALSGVELALDDILPKL